jgi:hypothetical protein
MNFVAVKVQNISFLIVLEIKKIIVLESAEHLHHLAERFALEDSGDTLQK